MASNYSFAQFASQIQPAKPQRATLQSIFDEIDLKEEARNRKPKIAQFRVHPLVAIEHYIAERNTNNSEMYPRYELFANEFMVNHEQEPYAPINTHLMTITRDDIPNYEELQELVNDTVEHFRTECTMIKLQGEYVSEWLETVMSATKDMDNRQLHPDHLKPICKLVPFYLFDKQIINASNALHLDSVTDLVTGRVEHKCFKGLKLLYTKHPQNASDKDRLAYFFQTKKNHMLQVNVNNLALRSAIDTILKLNSTIDLDISFKKRTMYANNFSYMVSQHIQGVSA